MEFHLVPVCIFEFYAGVTHCEPGNAAGCFDLNNRGQDGPEITCWPKQKHGKFTTGEGEMYTFRPEPITLNAEEKRICSVIGLEERDLHTFLRDWQPVGDIRDKPITLEEVRRQLSRFGL